MSSTPYKIYGRDTDFSFFEGVYHIPTFRNQPEKVLSSSQVVEGLSTSSSVLDLISNRKKIFVAPIGAFFHSFNDTIGPLIQQYTLDSNVDIIIDTSIIGNPMYATHHTPFNDDSFTGFFIKALKDAGASVTLINRNDYDAININNFYINDYKFYVGDTYSAMFELFKNQIGVADVEPHRNVYLSRKQIPSRVEYFTAEDGSQIVSNDNRSDNEELLEAYFKTIGFEVVCPEDFDTFRDQIEYMYSVKTLISLSGSGLMNSVFMQPSQTVVEIVTPLAIPFDDSNNPYGSMLIDDLHHFYSVMAFKKGHTYIAIPNKNKGSFEIIEHIENNFKLKQMLGSI